MRKLRYKGAPNIIMPMLSGVEEINLGDLIYNAVQELQPLLRGKSYKPKAYAELSLKRLCKQGLVKKRRKNGRIVCSLTKEGKLKLLRHDLRDSLNREKVWDGKWRLVIFDISEDSKRERDHLRRELHAVGLIRLQNSVWVYPHDCYEYIGILKTSFKLDSNVLYAEVERLEGDEELRRRFNL